MNQLPISSEVKYTMRFGTSNMIYWFILTLLTTCFIALYTLRMEIGINAFGALRPYGDKFAIRAGIGGNIDSIRFKEGDVVQQGQVIFSIKNLTSKSKLTAIETELRQKKMLREDLLTICRSDLSSTKLPLSILTPVYIMQIGDYFFQTNARNTALKKSEYESEVAEKLFKDSVISVNEYFKYRNEHS
ncbi:MAG: biotin/lipoyl-binding protein, partial [Sphingobacteriales bacterium]